MLAVALIAGLLAIVLANRWIQSQAGKGQGADIAVAVADVPMGTFLTPEMFKLVPWPEQSRPDGAFTELAPLKGRVLIAALEKGEPIIERRLAPQGSKGGLTAIVAPGKRAITVRVNDVVGVAGFALPGTYVDVLVNTELAPARTGGAPESISKIVLERILVLAVAQDVARDSTKPQLANAVTLEVTPAQAELLDLARSVGALSLVLRNQTEDAPAGTAGVTKEALLGLREQGASAVTPAARPAPTRAAPASQAAPRPAARECVEVLRAGSRSQECF